MFTIEGRGNTILPVPVLKTEISQSSLLRRFARDDKGQIAIIFGLTTFIVCALVGGAIDIGRWVSARNQTQAAIDSALLAAGRTAQTTYGDATKSINAAKAYYAQMKSSIVVNDSITFVANSTATSFTATGTAYVATPFLQFACPQIMPGCQSNPLEKLPVLTEGGTKQAESTIAQGGNSGSSIEIGLMLDTTGSMAGQKIEDLKAAAKDLVEIVVWDDQSNFTSRIGLAPFSGAVNVGDYFQTLTNLSAEAVSHTETQQTGETPIYTYPASCYNSSGKLKSSCKNKSQYITGYTPIYETVTVIDSTAKAKCVVERTGTSELTETAPGPGSWIPSWNVVRNTSSLNCPETSPIVPLTNNKSLLLNAITNLPAQNYTGGALGTAWAWYLISPEWNSIFTGAAKADSYSKMSELGPSGQPRLRKIAILMTDGEYNRYQDASATVSTVNTKAKAMCTGMKAKGITVYTVGFELGGSTSATDVLSKCATDASHFYNADNGDALKAAFRDIALKISALRISH